MPSACSVLVICVWVLLLCLHAWHVASLKGGKEVDNAIIRAVGGDKAADVWIPRFVFNHRTICAGVTLTAEADLTSASCLNDDEPLEAFVVVESHGQNEPPVQVAHIDRCVKFDKDEQHVHDLMVCFHQCQWNFSDYVFVPRINLESDRVPSEFDKTCSVMGFGHLTPEGDKCNVLHTLEFNVGTSQDCGTQDNTVQNYVCGETAEQQESCAVDSGEPLLCQHNSSKFFIHGICKQDDCSAPQKYSKFILLSYYKEWLERIVPGLASSSGPHEDTSSQVEEGDVKTDVSGGDAAEAKNNQKTDGAVDESEKCPVLAPPVHVHNPLLTEEEDLSQETSTSGDGTSSSSVAPNAPHSSDTATSDVTVPEVQNSDGTARQPAPSAELALADRQDSPIDVRPVSVSGAAHDPSLLQVAAQGDGSDSDSVHSTATSLPSSKSPLTVQPVSSTAGSRDATGDILQENILPKFVLEKDSEPGNSELVDATHHNTSPADDKVPLNATAVQTPPVGLPPIVPLHSADNVLNITVLLASLGDDWYLSNATHSAPHLSGSDEKLDIDQLEKLISENGALLNFSYVVDSANLSLPGNRNRSVETVPKLRPLAADELATSLADSPNSVLSNQVKSASLKMPEGQIAVDSSKTENVLPSGGESPIQEMGRDKPQPILVNLPHTDVPKDSTSSSVSSPQSVSVEPPRMPPIGRPAAPNTLPLSPTQWDWLKQNAMRVPKNPLKNPKVLGKTLLFKQTHRKYNSESREQLAEEYWHRGEREMTPDFESSGFPSNYRDKWSAQVLSYPHQHASQSSEDHVKSPQVDTSHPPGNGLPRSGISSRAVHDGNFRMPSSVTHVTPSVLHDSGRSRRSLVSKKARSSKVNNNRVDSRIWRNAFVREGPSRDIQLTSPKVDSPVSTAELKERQHSSPSVNQRQPEGTFFGVVSSSVKTRLKRSGIYDDRHRDPADWNTLLADLASWPARAGVAPSELTPRVSFLTAVNETYSPGGIPSSQSFYLYFKLLRAFFPGGNVQRRLDMYKKKMLWGPPITHGEFSPLKPIRTEVAEEETPPEEEGGAGEGEGEHEECEEPEAPDSRLQSAEQTTAGTAADEHIHRQARDVRKGFSMAPRTGIQRVRGGDSISGEPDVKNESHSVADHNSSYSRPPNRTDVSDQPDRRISWGAIDARKQNTLSTVDAQKEATHPPVDTQKETTLPPVDTHRETILPPVNTQKEITLPPFEIQKETTLPPVDEQKEITLPPADTQKETTFPPVDTRRETTLPPVDTRIETTLPPVDIRKETALPPEDTRKETALPPVNTRRETALPPVDTRKETVLPPVHIRKETALSPEDTRKETTLPPVNTRRETTLPPVDTRKEPTLPPVDTRRETAVPPVDTRQDTALPSADKFAPVDTRRETAIPPVDTRKVPTVPTAGAEKVSTTATVSTGKLNLSPTIRRMIEIEQPSEEKNCTSSITDDTEGGATESVDEYHVRGNPYGKIKQLGADDGANAAQKVVSIFGVALTLVLTWISMPQD